MKTPTVPPQRVPVFGYDPELNEQIRGLGVLWLWGNNLDKKQPESANETLLEVFPTRDVIETLRGINSMTGGPRRYATQFAFQPFEGFEEAQGYASYAIALHQPEDQTRPAKLEPRRQEDAQQ